MREARKAILERLPDEQARELFKEIVEAYDRGGKVAVQELIREKVKKITGSGVF